MFCASLSVEQPVLNESPGQAFLLTGSLLPRSLGTWDFLSRALYLRQRWANVPTALARSPACFLSSLLPQGGPVPTSPLTSDGIF